MTKSRKPILTMTIAAVALLALSGCGDSEDATTGSAGSATGSTSAAGGSDIPEDFCTAISADDIGKALGVAVTTKTGPSGDCEFSEEDPRGASGSVGVVGFGDTNGGYSGYVDGLTATLPGSSVTKLTGIGAGAALVSGSMSGTSMKMVGGAADLGDRIPTVTLLPGTSLEGDAATKAAEALLRAVTAAAK